jgi:hypothetical protein
MRTKHGGLLLITALMTLLFTIAAHAQEAPSSGDYQYTLDDGGKATIVRYTGAETGTLAIPDQLDGHPVAAIGQAAFMGNKFTSVVIPAGLTSITPGVFCNCTGLVSIDVAAGNPVYEQAEGVLLDKVQKALHTYPIARAATEYQIPDGTLIIGSGAFFGCEQLTSVMLPGSLTSIGENAFYGCTNLLSLTIPGGVAAISNGAFSLCGALNTIAIPGSVKTIGTGVFDGCLNLASITVNADNPVFEVIGGVLFDKQQKLLHTYPQALSGTDYQVPDGTLQIGSLAFASCKKLISVIIPDSVAAIGESAFLGCTELNSAVLPKGLTMLPASIFAACEHLKSIQVPDGVTSIGAQAFSNCTDLKQANIPYGATEVGPYAFAYCGNLREMTIPATVVSIGDGAFMACDFMASVLIQPGVQSIGAYAFSDCSYMTTASIPQTVLSIGESAFSGCGKLVASVVENSFAHDYFFQNKLEFTFSK